MRIVAIIQARMGSNRLPGKVMMNIEGKSMLWHIVERLKKCKKLDDVVIATSDLPEDDVLVKFAKSNEYKIVRGDAYDVLGRYLKAARESSADYIVRICADSPLIDPETTDKIIEEHLKSKADYTSNVGKRAYPGLYAEIFSMVILEKAERMAKENYCREHVTPFIREHPEIFSLKHVETNEIIGNVDMRLTVDEPEDMALIRIIYSKLYNGKDIVSIRDVIKLFEQMPWLSRINANVKQKSEKEVDERMIK